MPATTDPQDEHFQVLTPEGDPTGLTRPRGEIHRDGHWHRAVHIWIWGLSGASAPYLLYQRRSATKDTWPGRLDVAVGGHVRGFDSIEETLRESEEELGLTIESERLVRIGRRFSSTRTAQFSDNEMQDVFAYRSDWSLDRYRLHPEEVAGITQFVLDDVAALYRHEVDEIAGRERSLSGDEREVLVGESAFVPDPDRYALAVIERVRAIIAGRQFEPFRIP